MKKQWQIENDCSAQRDREARCHIDVLIRRQDKREKKKQEHSGMRQEVEEETKACVHAETERVCNTCISSCIGCEKRERQSCCET